MQFPNFFATLGYVYRYVYKRCDPLLECVASRQSCSRFQSNKMNKYDMDIDKAKELDKVAAFIIVYRPGPGSVTRMSHSADQKSGQGCPPESRVTCTPYLALAITIWAVDKSYFLCVLRSWRWLFQFLRKRIIFANGSFGHPVWPDGKISSVRLGASIESVAIHEHVTLAAARPGGGHEAWLVTRSRLATNEVWRAAVQEAGRQPDVALDHFVFRAEAVSVLGLDRCWGFLHRHGEQWREFYLLWHGFSCVERFFQTRTHSDFVCSCQHNGFS